MDSAAPDAVSQSRQEERGKPTRIEGRKASQQGNEGNERKAATSPQAHKERDTPPYCKGQAALPLITNSRQKISKKSLGGALKKFSEKFFVGMFRGKKNPSRFSTEGGCLTNENREISNLGNANNQKRTKAQKPRAKVGKRNHICKGYFEFVTSVR